MDDHSPQTLVEAVYAQLRQDIIRGRLAPDSKLRMSDLRERYNVGASPLREALNRLMSGGLVAAIGQKGFHVPPLSHAELLDLTETRILIETEALRQSIAAGDDAWESSVEGAFHALRKIELAPDSDSEEREKRNRAFHMALVSACPLKKLVSIFGTLYDQHERYRAAAFRLNRTDREVHREHKKICEAALTRDADLATNAARDHVLVTAQLIEAEMRRVPLA
ncbi:HTH-type transcriptional repressor GlaR (plasmid) [Sphingobium sp. AntQ-1]|uniref:GntR family transcriptional regulator n=1 Tax=Sphingobium sp. AntQ-1 TaxID=2930091 RepID=UPI00234ECFD3|nr:FCD domain-containing protein [Sphingobium sp. AntQ-1]WCP15975.1 HTH-type transcriptional repressor GlaR [Sphingobium sp. AntQ-1]